MDVEEAEEEENLFALALEKHLTSRETQLRYFTQVSKEVCFN